MNHPHILHHGAVSGVAGSCRRLQVDAGHAVPIDSRVFQGSKSSAQALARVRKGRKLLAFTNLLTVDSRQAPLSIVARLAETAQPAAVIAGNGICSSWRIVNYLKAMLQDRRRDVLIVGYQAQGDLGNAIQAYGPQCRYVDLDEKRYKTGARITTIGVYSARAEQTGLWNFVARIRQWLSEIHIVYSQQGAKEKLQNLLISKYKKARKTITSAYTVLILASDIETEIKACLRDRVFL